MAHSSGLRVAAIAAVGVGLAACDDVESLTSLNPGGPPMVRQVLMREIADDVKLTDPPSLAFGKHDAAKSRVVTSALGRRSQRIRIVMDELLRGNELEEIECRGRVDDDNFARVPVGATPSDIARCAQPTDVLARTCHAGIPNSVCLGPDGPVGVQDRMPVDGAADHNQFIQGSVGIRCGATDARGGEGQGRFSTGGQGPGSSPPERAVINVPIDVEKSYWQPSGNQQIPASPAGIEALGPAIVLRPKFGLPMGASCTIVFAEEVVDKDGIRPCAPPNGDIDADCTPGDTSAVTFGVEPMDLVTVPKDGDANVPRIGEITLDFNAIMNGPRLLEEVVVAKGGVRVTGFVLVENLEPDRPSYKLKLPGGFEASTAYTVTVPATVVDRFEQPLGYDVTFQFTTAAN